MLGISIEQGSFFPGKRHKEVLDSKNLSRDTEKIKEEVCKKYVGGNG